MLETLREKANNLPLLPGVYIMKDAEGEVIYVGKAKALKNRVSSYFRGEHTPKVQAMVDKVADFDVIIASSEFEALVLENSLIKRHMPRYNILLRDDKGYPFIRLDVRSEYPRMSVAAKRSDDGAKYFGPFGGRSTTHEIIDTLCKTFGLPTCGKRFPRDVGKSRPCLHYHMGNCRGYCLKDASAEEYRASMRSVEMVLSGKAEELIAELREKMQEASDSLSFELAAEYRDRLRAVESLRSRQRVIANAAADTDVVGFYRGARTCFAVLHYMDGSLTDKHFSIIDDPIEDDAGALSALLGRYYGARGTPVRTILLPFETEDMQSLEALIGEKSGHRVSIEVPKRGERAKLTESACVNAREEYLRATNASQRRVKTLEWLERTLCLDSAPRRIEAFDISNTGSFGIVAAMTVFVNGKPLKRAYKRFRMQTVKAPDDYASMYEAVYRRYAHCVQGDEGFEEVPDLILIDGGSAHAASAESALASLGLTLPVFGMVKDDRHRTRALVTSGGEEIGIVSNGAVFSFIGNIQEETHRFAIEYHRSLRSKTIASTLDGIEGVGEKRKMLLLERFKSVKAIKSASAAELAKVVPRNTAEAIYNYFHNGETQT